MKAKKQMTIDDLAVIVKKGFQDADRKMATKDMLKDMATKDMLTNLATKDMLKDMATKDMLTNLATKKMVEDMVDDLAGMAQKGFLETGRKIDVLQADVNELKSEMVEVKDRLDRIEKIFLVDHKHRIERLEFEVKNLKDLFALK